MSMRMSPRLAATQPLKLPCYGGKELGLDSVRPKGGEAAISPTCRATQEVQYGDIGNLNLNSNLRQMVTWVELLITAIFLHVNIFWRFMIWTIAVISLPVRALTALERERLLEMHLHETQIELENLMWDRKGLEDRLQRAIKEYRMMEVMLTELEEEHDRAIVKIKQLEGELQDVKDEYIQLKEIMGKEALESLFSAVLSLLVGMIIWEAEDPCMPLVVALFTVVGISLKSVVRFFSTIKNKPASDAVALLSFNWFILGTLTYPTLPRVARMLTPPAKRFLERSVFWLGISS
ncbi:hypothetical protein F0562_011792 [Nyssa sinensis]|uniref:Uncharacterized protein n=1 Tax=Nyssa sinensis TaxID=561372 RepID=A0A5J4ZQS9_9ASTE|nr:hypothetical protein F0562_011792 [Nyssa sinensis]